MSPRFRHRTFARRWYLASPSYHARVSLVLPMGKHLIEIALSNINDGFTRASNPRKPDCIRLRLLQYASLSEVLKGLLHYNGCGHRTLAVRRLHTFRSAYSRQWVKFPSPSFVLLIVTSSLMTDRRAGVRGKKTAKPSRLRSRKKAKSAF